MIPNLLRNDGAPHPQQLRWCVFLYLAVLVALVLPGAASGQDASDTINTACTFASNINKILNAVSIVVVTIAVVFAGYQIAYAHKRIGDVAPVLIGAILIGAAGQIAKMFLAGSTSAAGTAACTAGLVTRALDFHV